MKDKGQEKKRRAFWQARLDDARRQYAEKRERMDRREDCYKGTRHIPAAGGGAAKAAGNVRNITVLRCLIIKLEEKKHSVKPRPVRPAAPVAAPAEAAAEAAPAAAQPAETPAAE